MRNSLCIHFFALTTIASLPAYSNDDVQPKFDICSTGQSTQLYVLKDHGLQIANTLPRHMLIVVIPQKTMGIPFPVEKANILFVKTLMPLQEGRDWKDGVDQGWVRGEDVVNLSALLRGLVAHAGDRDLTAVSTRDPLEFVLDQQPEGQRQAWQEITIAIRDNEKLAERLPELYQARGDFRSTFGDHERALDDYLAASDLIRRSSPNQFELARNFIRLHDALRARKAQPKPPYYGEAWEHYAKGYHAYWARNPRLAAEHFSDAIDAGPETSIFHYYRALALKQLGDNDRAVRDVVRAVYFERVAVDASRGPNERSTSSRHSRDPAVSQQLERVQGDLRLWVEGFRSGIGSRRASMP